ncbi:MAG TPA: hypothetical protein VK034_31660 [Enhygromyxa sp.]|nr:hypothetical protein [Enhygromyxa sp.]
MQRRAKRTGHAASGTLLRGYSAPEGFSDFDWLSRCESIYVEQELDGVGFVYRRIGNHQVKLSNAYEDGMNLKLVSAEVMS